jgi:hypothetical protein
MIGKDCREGNRPGRVWQVGQLQGSSVTFDPVLRWGSISTNIHFRANGFPPQLSFF